MTITEAITLWRDDVLQIGDWVGEVLAVKMSGCVIVRSWLWTGDGRPPMHERPPSVIYPDVHLTLYSKMQRLR